jgi:hypothetical protein
MLGGHRSRHAPSAKGMELGFGRPGGPGGFGGGPAAMLASTFLTALDADKNEQLTREEFVRGFGRWFESWNADKSGFLSEDQLRTGLDKDLVSQPGGRAPFGR